MRTFFETSTDLANERQVIEECCASWHCTAKKLPAPPYKVDWLLFCGGEPIAFAEVKCRTKFYNPFLIGLHKFQALVSLASATGLKSLIIVRWEGKGVFWIDVTPDHDGIRWMQDRREREDADGEPCVALAVGRFKEL